MTMMIALSVVGLRRGSGMHRAGISASARTSSTHLARAKNAARHGILWSWQNIIALVIWLQTRDITFVHSAPAASLLAVSP